MQASNVNTAKVNTGVSLGFASQAATLVES